MKFDINNQKRTWNKLLIIDVPNWEQWTVTAILRRNNFLYGDHFLKGDSPFRKKKN